MRIGGHDLGQRVFIIAEIGNNHEGDVDVARSLIDHAGTAGADAVKFQTMRPESLVRATDTARVDQLRRLSLDWAHWPALAEHAAARGVAFLSTPFDLDAVDVLEPLVPAFKIASGDNDFVALLERVAATGKPVLLSTGLADRSAIDHAKSTLGARWDALGVTPGLALMHCVTSYPTTDDDANVAAVATFASDPDIVAGYSDHTLGHVAAVMAVALGARVIEKHFTLAHDYSDFRDHQLSATPDELAELVEAVRRAERMRGTGVVDPASCERAIETQVRRSIVAAQPLPSGHLVEPKDLAWTRPGTGLRCGREDCLVGRRLVRAVGAGEPLREGDVT